jgi:branched-chain amino acid transport system substrate-binding protein
MVLQGNLDEVALSDLLQVYCSGGQAGRLTVRYPDAPDAIFYFDAGDLIDAQFGSRTGADAVWAALERNAGAFRVDIGIAAPRRSIDQPWSVVVMEGMRRLDEQRANPGAPPGPIAVPARPLRAVSGPRPPEAGVPPPASGGAGRAAAIAAVAAAVLVGAGGLWFLLKGRAPAPVPAPEPPASVPLTLGMSTALSGPSRELGRQMKMGVETALNLANEARAVPGRTLGLLALDDGYEPSRTKDAMKELVEVKKVFAVLGNVGTPTAEVAVPYANEKKTLFFGAFTGAGLLRKDPPDRYVFNYRASYVEETAAVVRWFVEVKKLRPAEIAVFAQQDAFGDAGFAGVAKALRKYGRAPDEILRVGFKRNTLELQEAVDTVLKNRKTVKAIVMVAPYRPAAKFIEEMKRQQLDAIFSNVSFVGATAFADELRQLGGKFASGVIVTQVVPPIDSSATAVIRYREALQKFFPGEKPDFVSLEGYVVGNLFVEGLKRAGANLTTDRVIEALEGIRDLDLGIGTKLSFGLSEHQASHKVWGTILNDAAQYQVLDLE